MDVVLISDSGPEPDRGVLQKNGRATNVVDRPFLLGNSAVYFPLDNATVTVARFPSSRASASSTCGFGRVDIISNALIAKSA